MPDTLLEDIHGLALHLGERAAVLMRSGRDRNTRCKADGSPVTDVDTAVNDMVVAAVAGAYPDHHVLGEEGTRGPEDAPWSWVCDPIDGTVPFVAGIGVSTFSLAVCLDGVPQAAVVVDPWTATTWTAVRGLGAYRNGTPLHVTGGDLHDSLVFVCVHDSGPVITALAHEHGARPANLRAGVRCAVAVADGAAAASLHGPLNPAWDVAAAVLIAQEAGATALALDGSDLVFGPEPSTALVIAAPAVAERVAAAWARLLPAR